MLDYFIYIIAFFITLPIIATIVAYFLFGKIYAHKWQVIHSTVRWTTIWYVVAVPMLLRLLFDRSFIGIILLLLLVILMIIIYYQWKVHTEVEMKQAIKILWRICFLLFLLMYLILVCFGIVRRIFY